MPNRAKDWFAQALRDLEQSRDSRAAGRHEWACFAGQQAAEKAVAQLLPELPAGLVSQGLADKARVLDNFYVATQYANGHPAGAPFEHYGSIQSDQAIQYAGEIIEFARSEMAAARGS